MEKIRNDIYNEPPPSCPGCEGTKLSYRWKDIFNNHLYGFYQCEHCRLLFVWPIPTIDDLVIAYSNYQTYSYSEKSFKKAYPKSKTLIANWKFGKKNNLIAIVKKLVVSLVEIIVGQDVSYTLGVPLQLNKNAKILEIGSGSGKWLLFMHQQGFVNLYGQDITDTAKKRLVDAGVIFFQGELKDITFEKNTFDLIHADHVIEHMRTPLEDLKVLHNLLKPGGKLVLTVPTIDSFSYIVGKDKWLLDFPRHIFHFSLKSMSCIAARAGYSIERSKYLPFWPQMVYSINNKFPIYRVFNNQLTNIAIAPIYGIFSRLFRKGDYLSIVLRK